MTTTYIKTPVSEKPEKDGTYFTSLGLLYFASYDGKQEWLNSGCKEDPQYWMKPIEPSNELQKYKEQVEHLNNEIQSLTQKLVPAESISLEEAKNKIANNYGWGSWQEQYNADDISNVVIDEVAELYHNQNTAALTAELEQLKANDKAGILVSRELADNIHNTLRERDQLQQQVKTLADLLKRVVPMAEDGYKYSVKACAHQEFLAEDRELLKQIKEALSTLNP